MKTERDRLEKFKQENKDGGGLSQQENVIKESIQMIEQVKSSLLKQKAAVEEYIEENKEDPSLKEGEQWEKAKNILDDVDKFIQEILND